MWADPPYAHFVKKENKCPECKVPYAGDNGVASHEYFFSTAAAAAAVLTSTYSWREVGKLIARHYLS